MKKFIVLFLLFFALPCGASFDHNLYYGLNNNQEVWKLQEFLTSENVYSGPITGNFYSLTLQGVKNFQTREEITPISGYFGPLSRTRANEILSEFVDESGKEFIPPTTTPATNEDIITELKEQIALLQSQLAKLQEMYNILFQQNQTLQEQSQTLGEIKENTTPIPIPEPIPPPEPVKKITMSNRCSVNENGRDCGVYAYYWENDVRKNTYITISSNDPGVFVGYNCSNGEPANSDGTQRKGNPLTCATQKSGKDGKPEVHFQYRPINPDTITFIATTNGASGTTSCYGQVEKCVGIPNDPNEYYQCNL